MNNQVHCIENIKETSSGDYLYLSSSDFEFETKTILVGKDADLIVSKLFKSLQHLDCTVCLGTATFFEIDFV
jgi:hypothetical protein